MTLQVTMHIFSGRPDPQWTIEGAEEQEFRRLIASSAADSARPIVPWRIGYRGFTVVDPAVPDQPIIRIQNRSIASFSFYNAPEIEGFLIRTGPADLPFRPEDIIPSAPIEPSRIARAVTCPPSMAADAPLWPNSFAPGDGNCYNYAANRVRITQSAIPGRATRNIAGVIGGGLYSGANCLSGSLTDGLLPTQYASFVMPLAAGEGHYVCLVVWPNEDFHWYRQDSNGCWSHKLGGTPITNLDNSGREIPDPRTADRGAYTLFVSFLIVPPSAQVA